MKNIFICDKNNLANALNCFKESTLLIGSGVQGISNLISRCNSIDIVGAGENFSYAITGRASDIVFVSENQEEQLRMRKSAIENNFSIFQ
jgi:hypothetical protein